MTRDLFRLLVEAEFCRDHLGAGSTSTCEIGRRAAAAALAVLDANHWPFADLDHLKEIVDDTAHV